MVRLDCQVVLMNREIIHALTGVVTANEGDQRTIDIAGNTIFRLSKRIQSQANHLKLLTASFQKTKERQEKACAQWSDALKARDDEIYLLSFRINQLNKRLISLGEDDDIIWINIPIKGGV